jgi:succinyl-diaminopimelate desuccinylase
LSGLAATLSWLVDIPSVTGSESRICSAIADRLRPTLGDEGLERVGDSLVAGRRSGRPLLILAGHLDTVPSQGQGLSRIENGRLHGLGATDMKSGVAVMLNLLEDAAVQGGPFDVVGVFYAGEEGPSDGNQLEAVLLSAPWLEQAEFAVVLEPSDGEIQLGCNGVINARVRFNGLAAHSARPWLGVNAITKAGAWLASMHDRQPEPVEIGGLIFREVMTITKANGGIANNIIPSSFDLNLNYRFAPTRTMQEAEVLARDACAEADEVVIVDAAPAGPVEVTAPFLDRLIQASSVQTSAKQGWTDVARFGVHAIPAINYGPGETTLAHKVDESVALKDVETVFENLRRALTN